MAIKEKIRDVARSIANWAGEFYGEPDVIPSEKDKSEDRASYVTALYKEANQWRQKSLNKRINNLSDPIAFWRVLSSD